MDSNNELPEWKRALIDGIGLALIEEGASADEAAEACALLVKSYLLLQRLSRSEAA